MEVTGCDRPCEVEAQAGAGQRGVEGAQVAGGQIRDDRMHGLTQPHPGAGVAAGGTAYRDEPGAGCGRSG
ncbi:hypothetical protein GCM10009657_07270 [Oryzihumus leptocrescens]